MRVAFSMLSIALMTSMLIHPNEVAAQINAGKLNGNGLNQADGLSLVQKHVYAQANFDQKTLEAITHSQYIEVSPAGEVDERSKMLGFYSIENKKQVPVVEVLEPVFREVAEAKLVIAKLRYKMQVGEQARQFSIRASYLLCKEKADWKVCSAQYTGIR